jgi:hypothetical protein
MNHNPDILNHIKESADKKILFLSHAVSQMCKPDRMITTEDIETVIGNGEVIEDYPEDSRGHSCLILGYSDGRPIHVVCSPKDDYLAIVTAYLPSDQEWNQNFKTRKKP